MHTTAGEQVVFPGEGNEITTVDVQLYTIYLGTFLFILLNDNGMHFFFFLLKCPAFGKLFSERFNAILI